MRHKRALSFLVRHIGAKQLVVFSSTLILIAACAVYKEQAFTSAEVRFADVSKQGLAIIPASCASSVEHWPGACSPGCSISIVDNGNGTLSLSWNIGEYSNDYGYGVDATVTGIGYVSPHADAYVITTPGVNTTYVFSGHYLDAEKKPVSSFSCSAQYVAAPAPPPPTGLSATCPSNTASLSWDATPGATYYEVRVNDTAYPWTGNCGLDGEVGNWCWNGQTAPSLSIPGLYGSSYSWWVHACNASGCGDPTHGSNFNCSVSPPGTGTVTLTACNPFDGASCITNGQSMNVPVNGHIGAYWSTTNINGNCNYTQPDGTTISVSNQNSSPGLGGYITRNPTILTLACTDLAGNPVSASVTLVPQAVPPPANVIAACSPDGTFAAITWDAIPGASGYQVVVNTHSQTTCPTAWSPGSYAPNNNYCWLDTPPDGGAGTVANPGATFTTTVGSYYSAWVKTKTDTGESGPSNETAGFSCKPKLSVSCSGSPSSISPGGSATWSATVVGGKAPYSYSWTDSQGHLGSGTSASWGPFTYAFPGTVTASVGVLDANSKSATADCTPVTVTTGTCQDPTANNYGQPLPCTYTPGGTCQDHSANNYGQPLPCTYTPGGTCQDHSANNYGQPLPCTYGADNYNCKMDGPAQASPGEQITLSWTTSCSKAFGCTWFGLPLVASNAIFAVKYGSELISSESVSPNGSKTETFPPYELSVRYELSGTYYPLGVPLFGQDTFHCAAIVQAQTAKCPDGSAPPGGDLSKCTYKCTAGGPPPVSPLGDVYTCETGCQLDKTHCAENNTVIQYDEHYDMFDGWQLNHDCVQSHKADLGYVCTAWDKNNKCTAGYEDWEWVCDKYNDYYTPITHSISCSKTTDCPYAWAGYGCALDTNEAPYCAEPPNVQPATFDVRPPLVRKDSPVKVTWASTGGQSIQCTASGTNGDSWTNIDAGSHTTSLIVAQTIYTLECIGRITHDVLPAQTRTVNIVPKVNEK